MKMSKSHIIFIVVAIFLLAFAFFVHAQTSDQSSLQSELGNLTFEVDSGGYSWLINYTGGLK